MPLTIPFPTASGHLARGFHIAPENTAHFPLPPGEPVGTSSQQTLLQTKYLSHVVIRSQFTLTLMDDLLPVGIQHVVVQ